jgi:predicted RNase H-like HicB family nuclease
MPNVEFTVEIEKEQLSTGEDVYVAFCREIDIASQGSTVEEALKNLEEAVILWLETASVSEVENCLPGIHRKRSQVFTTRIEVPYAKLAGSVG